MNTVGKRVLVVVLAAIAVFCFARFRTSYNEQNGRLERFEEMDASKDNTAVAANADTNAATLTNAAVVLTNAVAEAPASTNAAASSTNEPPHSTNQTVAATASGKPGAVARAGGSASAKGQNKSVIYLLGFVVSLIAMAVLFAYDFTQWLAGRATRGLGADLLPADSDPDYEKAEGEWAKGNHLDAIRLMREYLKRNASQQHVAIRIAEIYEKDLNNFLAAALELEDVLNKRLPREKWGWTAVHLANIYSGRLNQPEKAIQTLERIAADYPETSAAKKARQRLGLPEPDEIQVSEMAAQQPPPAPPEEPGNLPQGFRAKKR